MKGGMRTVVATVVVLLYDCVLSERWLEGQAQSAPPAVQAGPKGPPLLATVSAQQTLINQYCVACHNDRLKSGGLALSTLNLDAPAKSAEIAEKVIRKLRGGLMPPAGAKRPDAHAAA